MFSILKDLTGQRFGSIVVLERVEDYIQSNGRHRVCWRCRCDCGKIFITKGDYLKSGKTNSCGHIQRMNARKHGMSHTPYHNQWIQIRQRCNNPNHHFWKDYGGRGIKMFSEWEKSFDTYFSYISQLPHFGEKGYTINRINNDGNYEPGNVEWADKFTQANNTRKNIFLTWQGKTKTIAEWSKFLNIPYSRIKSRYDLGWSDEKIFHDVDPDFLAGGD